MLDIVRLRVLAAIAAHGSVTKAAKQLNYSQPAVSHHLARLEAETGARLVQRVGRGIRFTPEGEHPARRAAEIVGRVDTAAAELSAMVGLRTGRVRVAGFQDPMCLLSLEPGQALADHRDSDWIAGWHSAAWIPPWTAPRRRADPTRRADRAMLRSRSDRSRKGIGTLACALVVAAVAGCTGVSEHARQRDGAGSAAPRPAQDPPTSFAGTAIDLGAVYSNAYQAHRDVVYKFAAANELSAVELATGRTLWSRSLDPAARPPANGGVSDPVVADAAGELAVTIAYLVTTPDSVTGRDRAVARVAAVAARDGRPLWNVEIADDAVDEGIPVLAPRVVAVTGTRVVVSSYLPVLNSGDTDPRRHYTFVLDAATGQTRWSRPGFNVHTVSGAVVAGVDNVADTAASVANFSRTGPAQGRSLDDGALVWASDRAFAGRSGTVEPVPDVLVLEDELARGDVMVLVSASTGKVLATVDAILVCRDDEGGVLVCNDLHAQPSLMTAFDIRSGRRLWTLPDLASNRPALDLVGAYHGAVYATSVRSGSLVLDARTGKELVPTLAVTPDRVVPGYGLALADGGLLAYPTTT